VSQCSSGSPRKCFSDLKADRCYSGAKRHSKDRSFINCRAATAAVCPRFTRFSYAFRSKTRHSPQSTHAEPQSIHLRLFAEIGARQEFARGLAARLPAFTADFSIRFLRVLEYDSSTSLNLITLRKITFPCSPQGPLQSLMLKHARLFRQRARRVRFTTRKF